MLGIFPTLLPWAAAPADERSPLGQALKDVQPAEHWIYDDWPRAVAAARQSGKPLWVVVRCVPCPPGRALDQAVAQPDPELAALQQQFVCVRLIQANSLDLALFQYDYDMSWSALFMNADGTIYGRYGSRNASGPHSDSLLSLAALRKAAERALALHAAYPANRQSLQGKTGPRPAYRTPRDIPGLQEKPPQAQAQTHNSCIHCHMVKEYALRAKWQAGQLTEDDLYVYPLPQQVGLSLDLEDGLTVRGVTPGSPAEAAGVKVGDQLHSLGGQPLISLADVQWVLHHAPHRGTLPIEVLREGRKLALTLALDGPWKKSDLAWRVSSWYALRQGLKTEPLAAARRAELGLPPHGMALEVKGLFGKGEPKLKAAGLKVGDVIVAMDGRSPEMSESDFLVALRVQHGPHDAVRLTILREGHRRELTIPMW
jgi:hypothetical protein